MADDATTQRAQVRQWVLDDFGIELTDLRRVHGGLDDATLWCAEAVDASVYAVKWSAGGTDAGLLVPAALAAAGSAGVVLPLPTKAGRLWADHGGRRLSVSRWVPGPCGLDAGLGAKEWTALGALLARAHVLPAVGALGDALPRETYDPSTWTAWCDTVDVALDRPVGVEDDLVEAVRTAWWSGRERIRTVRRLADVRGRRIRARPVRPRDVVCHGDAHAGNVILGPDGPVLLDWDDAVLGPPERDYMFVVGGVIWFAPVSADSQADVARGYGQEFDIDAEVLAYVRCVRALEDVVEPAARVLAPDRWSRPDREEAAAIVAGVLSPAGLVTLAADG